MRNNFEEYVNVQLKNAEVVYSYETEKIPYTIYGSYLPDFVLNLHGGNRYIECKGFLRNEDKRKLRAVIASNPGMDLRLLFHKNCKQRDIKWAKRHGFIYAIDTIPEDWLMSKSKHPANRYERMKTNEKKSKERKDKWGEREGSNRTVPAPDQDTEE